MSGRSSWLDGMVDGLIKNPHSRVRYAAHIRGDAGNRDRRACADGDVVMLPHDGDVVGNGSAKFEARLQKVLRPDIVHAEIGRSAACDCGWQERDGERHGEGQGLGDLPLADRR